MATILHKLFHDECTYTTCNFNKLILSQYTKQFFTLLVKTINITSVLRTRSNLIIHLYNKRLLLEVNEDKIPAKN